VRIGGRRAALVALVVRCAILAAALALQAEIVLYPRRAKGLVAG